MTTKKKKWYSIKELEARFGRMTLGGCIRAFREAEEKTQAEFAKLLGLSRANLCDIEKGRKIPSPERAVSLARKMGMSPEYFLILTIQDSLREANLKYTVDLTAA